AWRPIRSSPRSMRCVVSAKPARPRSRPRPVQSRARSRQGSRPPRSPATSAFLRGTCAGFAARRGSRTPGTPTSSHPAPSPDAFTARRSIAVPRSTRTPPPRARRTRRRAAPATADANACGGSRRLRPPVPKPLPRAGLLALGALLDAPAAQQLLVLAEQRRVHLRLAATPARRPFALGARVPDRPPSAAPASALAVGAVHAFGPGPPAEVAGGAGRVLGLVRARRFGQVAAHRRPRSAGWSKSPRLTAATNAAHSSGVASTAPGRLVLSTRTPSGVKVTRRQSPL